jgi:hypothetical protein
MTISSRNSAATSSSGWRIRVIDRNAAIHFCKKVHVLLFSATGVKWRKSVADEEHLKIIRQGVEVWNEWRKKNQSSRPNLCVAYLFHAQLNGADLNRSGLASLCSRV